MAVDILCIVADGYKSQLKRLIDNIGIRINLNDAYMTYAQALTDPSEFYEARDAYLWCQCSWWRGLWRHGLYCLLFPSKYKAKRALASKGLTMQQQAVLNATLEMAQARARGQ